MGKGKFSNIELEKLLNQGMGVRQIAKKLKVSPSAVSQRLKALRVAVSRNLTIRKAGEMADKQLNVIHHLLDMLRRVDEELTYIEVKKKGSSEKERLKWEQAELDYLGEKRQIIKLVSEVYQVWYLVEQRAAFQKAVLTRIGNASPETREQILRDLADGGILARSAGFPVS